MAHMFIHAPQEYFDIIAMTSYLGMKSCDAHVCDRASTITHVDPVDDFTKM